MAKSTVTRRNPNALTVTRRNAAKVGKYRVQVGWSVAMGADEKTVEIAAINMLGADLANGGRIPARDVLTPTIAESLASVRVTNAAAVRAANRGDDPKPLLDKMAERLEERLKQNIDDATPENAQSTEDKKGFNQPLIGAGPDRGRIYAQAAARVLER